MAAFIVGLVKYFIIGFVIGFTTYFIASFILNRVIGFKINLKKG